MSTGVASPEQGSEAAPVLTRFLPGAVTGGALIVLWFSAGGSSSTGVWIGAAALGLCLALVAVGVYITFRVLNFPDLTIDGTYPLGAAVAAVLIVNGWSAWLSLVAAFLAGACFGAITALLSTKLRLHSLLASILVATALFSINLRIQGKANIPLLSETTIFTPISSDARQAVIAIFGDGAARHSNNILTIVLVGSLVVIMKLLFDVFNRSEIGLNLRGTGDNPQMMRTLGRNTDGYVTLGVAISNALVAVAGGIVAQFQGFADVNMGFGLIIAGLASVILGDVIFRPQRVSTGTLSAIGGMILYRMAIAAALAIKVPVPGGDSFRLDAGDIKLATAVLVLGMLWFSATRSKQ
ncbi:MAG: ABC transporter permease [Acidimicrobiaceae bacterium]|nr:ABC transporter permease [Acidimicrobiaceae bacterium]